MNNGNGKITVESDRIVGLEVEVENIKEDVGEIKGSVSDIRKSNTNIEKALVKLSVIAESNQKLEPRVTALERVVWRAIGGLSTIVTGVGLIAVVAKFFS